ncbi:MAG: indolepyruvate ferredoxin oxidoreductase subunit alpha [Candidatus Thermoplasmatota archaeon]|nr:indolepyruvate ferredoxin oxidoreductase subunit alpha [Candidatus Thermoplasmatota archaeon]
MKLIEEKNRRLILLGNEAVVRGAMEAGIDFAAAYPGTPSSEIADALAMVAKDYGMYYEYTVNEKVAMEMVAAASASNLKALTCMKHVGLNVASDAFMSIAYTGVRGGLVIVSADDPSMHSSQNEQDNRYYSLLANVPMLEPDSPQECYEMTKKAFSLSETLEMPVLMRTTTRVNHTSSDVLVGEVQKREEHKGHFEKDPKRFVIVPAVAYREHKELLARMEKAKEMSESSELNFVEGSGDTGIITSGVSYLYVKEAVENTGIKAKILKLGFTHPLPEKKCTEFLKGCKKVLVVEELEPFLETQILALKAKNDLKVEIHGKDLLPRCYEFDLLLVEDAIKRFAGSMGMERKREEGITVPPRPPVLCPGCPHRNAYYVAKQLTRGKAIFPNDIGCYTLGLNDPYNAADFLLCMGSSVGTACGFSKSTDQEVISFIGDSTFYHGGIPALIDGIHNNANFLLVVLDNRTTAMTGHQPTPGLPYNAVASNLPVILPEDIAKGCGVKNVEVVDGNDLRALRGRMKEMLDKKELGVLVVRAPCILLENRELRRKGAEVKIYEIDQNLCNQCDICIEKFGCPAFYKEEGKIWIADDLCNGCGVCLQVCGRKAIKVRE